MASGGGDMPSPLTGGEILLRLLQRPVDQHQQTPPFQQQRQRPVQPSYDPAVAALAPSLHLPFQPFQSNGHDLPYRPPWPQSQSQSQSPPLAPHHFFLQGFPQNPNTVFSSSPQPSGGFNHSLPLNHSLLNEDIQKLGVFGKNRNQNSASQHHEQNLMFGSMPCKIGNHEGTFNGNSYDNLNREREVGPGKIRFNEAEIQKKLDKIRFPEQRIAHRGSDQSAQVNRPPPPPPGFSSNPMNGRSSFEQDSVKGKHNYGQTSNRSPAFDDERARVHHGDSSGARGHAAHRNRHGPPTGNSSHTVSLSDAEDSVSELHDAYEGGSQGPIEFNHYEEQRLIGNLVLEDVPEGKKDRPKREHRSDPRGQWLLSQKMRNFKRKIECRSDIDRLNTPLLAIYESLIPAEEEKVKQKQLLKLLEKHITKEWPDAQLFLYGSSANSFGFTKSDVDLCLAIGEDDIDKDRKVEILLKLADILQSDNLQNVQALVHARVPIVKLMDPATGVSCDICVNNLLAVVNTKLLRDYSKIDVRLRQLAFLVKHWAKSRGVNETYRGTLSSYAYVLMCIHFLQQRRPAILPCLQAMERTYAVTSENIECAFFDQMEELHGFGSRNGESIAHLLWAFFNYWAYCHDYASDVISIRTGSTLSKRAKDWTTRIGNDRHLICIEDPFELSHDLGRVVDKHSIRVLREEFERAADILQYEPDPWTTLFEPYVPT